MNPLRPTNQPPSEEAYYTLSTETPEGTRELFAAVIPYDELPGLLWEFARFKQYVPFLRLKVNGKAANTLILRANAAGQPEADILLAASD